MEEYFKIHPIGRVRKQDGKTWIEIDGRYKEGLLGLSGFSHISILFWFHENDTADGRAVMQVHPRKNPGNPLTGVFATHSPHRPNLIGLTRCRIVAIKDAVIELKEIDARDNTPVIDIKCYIPKDEEDGGVSVPEWV